MCGITGQKLVRLPLGQHTLLHVELDLLARTLELVGSRTAKLLKARGKNAKISLNDIGKRKLGRVAISSALRGFYEYFDWMDKGTASVGMYSTLEEGFVSESVKFVNGATSCK